jgi:hypothetical protein
MAELHEIVRKNTRLGSDELNDETLKAAIAAFLRVRKLAMGSAQKPPSTGELIDWVNILHWKGQTAEQLNESPELPPYWEFLFKNMSDIDAHQAVASTKSNQPQ